VSLAVLRPLAFGELLDRSFGLYRKLFAPLLIVSVATNAIPQLLGLVGTMRGGWLGAPVLTIVSALLGIVGGSVATAASTLLVAGYLLGRPVDMGQAFARSAAKTLPLILTSICFILVVALGMIALIVPGVIAACGLILAFTALTVEELGPIDALGRSWELTKGFKGRMFGLMAVFSGILYLLMIGSSVIVGIALAAFGNGLDTSAALAAGQVPTLVVAIAVGSALVQVVVNPVLYCLLVTTYYDLRVRKEGFDLELLATTMEQPAPR
jgi:hypothetical protein